MLLCAQSGDEEFMINPEHIVPHLLRSDARVLRDRARSLLTGAELGRFLSDAQISEA